MNALNRHDDESLDVLVDAAINGTLDDADPSRMALTVSACTAAVAARDAGAESNLAISPSLRDRLLLDAKRHLPPTVAGRVGTSTENNAVCRPARMTRGGTFGWFAAAAGVALAAAAWWPRLQTSQPATPPASLAVSSQEKYDALIRGAADVVRLPWKGNQPGFENVTGEVVWSDARQEGYMRLLGLATNNPQLTQYQLWIIDPGRDKRPVDGGVFDIASTGEVIVPISAKLRVDKPEGFALTREKPGGVVVSKGPLLVVAARS